MPQGMMPNMATADTDEFEFSLRDRIRNLSLAPGYYNAMVPLIEAVANAVQAIEDGFGEDLRSGLVHIEVLYEGDAINGFRVSDNGVGLHEQNYGSFKRADSPYKLQRGGKGVGRLTWLKAFEKANISSVYKTDEGLLTIQFDFSSDYDPAIKNKRVAPASDGRATGTVVELVPYRTEYASRAPKREDGIAKEIVRHFIPYLISEVGPRFLFSGKTVNGDLRALYVSDPYKSREDSQLVDLPEGLQAEISVRHLLVSRALKDADANAFNTLFLCADKRPVKRQALDQALGLKAIESNYIYVGLVSSPLLDGSANQERTNFSLDEDIVDAIHAAALERTKDFLKPYVEEVRTEQLQKTQAVVADNPRFLVVANDVEEFVEKKLKLSQASAEEIYVELSRTHYRAQARVRREFDKASRAGDLQEDFERVQAEYMRFVTQDTAHTLAEYVVRRRAVLEAIEASRRIRPNTSPAREYEEAIHNFICPLRSTSDDLDYDDHNLWILDDRLAFYTYFHSDRQVGQITTESSAGDEPDISFFNLNFGFRRESHAAPVVIVEFKRPSRANYVGEDPVKQMMRYIRRLREGKIAVDKDGVELTEINKDTMFHGIIVADLNNQLLEATESTFVKRKTPDGLGRFGYDDETRTFIEIIPYSKLLQDAKTRNEAFFVKLGLK